MTTVVGSASQKSPRKHNELLRTARQEKHWTMLGIAERVGVSFSTYARWEAGKQSPSPRYLGGLCYFLGKTAKELGYDYEPEPWTGNSEYIIDEYLNRHLSQRPLQQAVEQVAQADSTNIQEVAASQLAISNSYYMSGLQQSKQSFFWSLIFAGIGIAFFCSASAVILFRQPTELAYVATIGGVVLELLSGTCFFLYRRATDQLAAFRTSLNNMEIFLLANSMCESLQGDAKVSTKTEVIRMMVGSVTKVTLSQPSSDSGTTP